MPLNKPLTREEWLTYLDTTWKKSFWQKEWDNMKDDDDTLCYRSELEAAVKAAVEAEREACAKVCDEAKANIWEFHPYAVREAANSVCTNLAAALRARGQA